MNQYSDQVIQLVNEILHQKFEVPVNELVPAALLKDDLKLDSLDFVDMFVILEQKLGSTPQNVDFLKIRTLGDIYGLVNDLQLTHEQRT